MPIITMENGTFINLGGVHIFFFFVKYFFFIYFRALLLPKSGFVMYIIILPQWEFADDLVVKFPVSMVYNFLD